jgi:hypothetical protein
MDTDGRREVVDRHRPLLRPDVNERLAKVRVPDALQLVHL